MHIRSNDIMIFAYFQYDNLKNLELQFYKLEPDSIDGSRLFLERQGFQSFASKSRTIFGEKYFFSNTKSGLIS